MKERPILFNGAMVRAILEGSKTQTRRAMNPQPTMKGEWYSLPKLSCSSEAGFRRSAAIFESKFGRPGDRLWVRETWQGPLLTEGDEFEAYRESPDDFKNPTYCEYAADGGAAPEFMTDDDELVCRWRPSIHMPRWASRITLEIASVRVERLQAISEADAMAEGCKNSLHMPGGRFANENYAHLWWTVNGDGSWEANPWVWAVEFRRLP